MVNLKNFKISIKKNLGISIPFFEDVFQHIIISNQNFSRSKFLFKCAEIFRTPDQKIIDIGTTLEFLYTATSLHRNIDEFDNSRRMYKYVNELLGSEASVLIGDYLLSKSFKILTHLGNLDILESVSLATKNISRGQVMEISETILLASPRFWYKVIRYKIAGLYGAGAQCAAHWAKASCETASNLFAFGEHFGIAAQIKEDIAELGDKKIIQKKLKNKELWCPISFLVHDCLMEKDRTEILKKFKKDFDIKEMSEEIYFLLKKYELEKKLRFEADMELNKAKFFLEKLEIDTKKVRSLTKFVNI
tara:strand:- start:2804 stop:3718 length:915 start_codon:yes stop_codon:yes gene_type:complete